MGAGPHYQSLTMSSSGTSDFLLVDPNVHPFQVSVSVYLSSGASITYTVEHTAHILTKPTDTVDIIETANMAGKTVSADQNYIVPISGIRLSVTSYTSGTASLIVRQANQMLNMQL